MAETKKPKIAETELDKLEKQFDKFDEEVKAMTQDRMSAAPKKEVEEQTKLSSGEIEKSKEIYLKPTRTISTHIKFNEKFREDYNFDKEYVHFIAENHECIGDNIEIWTKKYPGQPAEFWTVPTNKPIWGPRYLAEQIKKCCYHRLVMKDSVTATAGVGSFYGTMAADTTVQRLDARPVSSRKSVFTGANNF